VPVGQQLPRSAAHAGLPAAGLGWCLIVLLLCRARTPRQHRLNRMAARSAEIALVIVSSRLRRWRGPKIVGARLAACVLAVGCRVLLAGASQTFVMQ